MPGETARSGGLGVMAAAALIIITGCASAERGTPSHPQSLAADCTRAVAAGAHLDSALRTLHGEEDPFSRGIGIAAAAQALEISNASLHDARLTNLGHSVLVRLTEAQSAAARGESTPFDFADFERMWDQTLVSICGPHKTRHNGAEPF